MGILSCNIKRAALYEYGNWMKVVRPERDQPRHQCVHLSAIVKIEGEQGVNGNSVLDTKVA